MDAKAKTIAAQLIARIYRGSFSENDVHLLLLLLREGESAGSPVRELADFIAHRERDRGVVHGYIVANGRAHAAKRYSQVLDRVVFSPSELVDSANSCLRRQALPALPDAIGSDLTFCVMSLLQDVAFKVRDTEFSAGRLQLGVNGAEALLYATTKAKITVGFGVLRVPNRYFPSKGFKSNTIVAMPIQKILQIRFARGKPHVRLVARPMA
jgi:hypothetical protein